MSGLLLTEAEWAKGTRDADVLTDSYRDAGPETTIYLIRAGDAVKIGHARDVATRLRRLRVDNAAEVELLVAIRGTLQGEARIHLKFEHLRLRGEWFVASDELLEFAAFCRAAEERRLLAREEAA